MSWSEEINAGAMKNLEKLTARMPEGRKAAYMKAFLESGDFDVELEPFDLGREMRFWFADEQFIFDDGGASLHSIEMEGVSLGVMLHCNEDGEVYSLRLRFTTEDPHSGDAGGEVEVFLDCDAMLSFSRAMRKIGAEMKRRQESDR